MARKVRSVLQEFAEARCIAVVGASSHRQKVGHQVFRNLMLGNTEGHAHRELIPINPKGGSILGHTVKKTLSEVESCVDVVIIVTPASTVGAIIEEIVVRNQKMPAANRVTGVCIISAGFAESSKRGAALQHLLATRLQLAGVRLIGPNSLGLLFPHQHLNASFAGGVVHAGNIGLASQSGAMLTALLNAFSQQGVGMSFAVSLGNKADVNENECLTYALNDRDTTAVGLYVESFTHLPKFFELASQLVKTKPVIVLKGGTSARGQVASASHTAALATNQVLLEAASQQIGFTLVNTIEEFVNVLGFLGRQRHLPENTMVVTNAGGPAVTTVDRLQELHVPLAKWSATSRESLEELLPEISPNNPLDVLGDASPERFQRAVQIAQADPTIESLLVILTPQSVTDFPGTVEALIAHKGKKPLFVALIGGEQLEKYRRELRTHGIFCTAFPNDLVDLLAVLHRVAAQQYRTQQFVLSAPHTPELPHQLDASKVAARTLIPTLRDAFTLLKTAGFNIPAYHILSERNQTDVHQLKYPVFAKTANLALLHKKQAGAVYGKVENLNEALTAYQHLQQFGNQVLFQAPIAIDHELLVGIENDPQFGLYLTIGLGGSYTNIMADRAYVFLPASKSELRAAWLTTRAAQLFADQPELTMQLLDHLWQLQKLVMKTPWIHTLEINPLAISGQKIWAVDVKLSGLR